LHQKVTGNHAAFGTYRVDGVDKRRVEIAEYGCWDTNLTVAPTRIHLPDAIDRNSNVAVCK
jgi:hypothetical protein